MQMVKSTDYHDYVIKDGKLIGDFEGMYKYASEIPWHQDKTAYSLTDSLLLELISYYSPYDSVCEIGCGLGYFLDRIQRKLTPARVTGFDISCTAITQAKKRFHAITFEQMDITKECKGKYNCIIFKGLLWYVFPQLPEVIKNLNAMLSDDGVLCIWQPFPPNADYVGIDVIKSHEHLRDIFSKDFDLLYFSRTCQKETNFETIVQLVYKKRKVQ